MQRRRPHWLSRRRCIRHGLPAAMTAAWPLRWAGLHAEGQQ